MRSNCYNCKSKITQLFKRKRNKTKLNKDAFFKKLCKSEECIKNPGEFVVVANAKIKFRTMNEQEAAMFIMDKLQDDCYLHQEGRDEIIYIF